MIALQSKGFSGLLQHHNLKVSILRLWALFMVQISHLCMFSSVQALGHVWLFATLWTAACQAFLSINNSQDLLKFMSTDLVILSNHLILCYSLLLLPWIFPSIRIFSNESVLRIRWPKYWNFSFSISPSNEYSGLISFTIDWFDLALSILFSNTAVQKHQFFGAQLSLWSNSNINTWLLERTIALSRQTFVS